MKLLQSLLSRPSPLLPEPVIADPVSEPISQADEAQACCCGWFDSSHDLRAGLQVREHAANDAACAELPLAMWLELQQACG